MASDNHRIKGYYAVGSDVWSCWYQMRKRNGDVYEKVYGSDKREQACESEEKAKRLVFTLNGGVKG